jgi:hypothetical protein
VTHEFLRGLADERGDASRAPDSGALDVAEISAYH